MSKYHMKARAAIQRFRQQQQHQQQLRQQQHATEYAVHQQELGRPVSPHLTVYKQSIPAIASITNRVCSIALSLGFGAGAAAASVGRDVPSLIHAAQDAMVPGLVPATKFAVAFPLAYHWLAGVRHTLWNSKPELINMHFASRSSVAMLAAAALVAVGATACSLEQPVAASSLALRRR